MTASGGRNSDERKLLHDALVQLRERLNSPSSPPTSSADFSDVAQSDDLDSFRLVSRQGGFETDRRSWFSWRLITVGGAFVLAVALGSTFFFADLDGSDPAQTHAAKSPQLLPGGQKADRESMPEAAKIVATEKIRNAGLATSGSVSAFALAPDAPLPSDPSQQDDKLLPWPAPPQGASGPQSMPSSAAAAPAAQTSPRETERHLDPQQAATLMQRAEALVANGDVTAARLILQRLAQGKDARAAYLLAKTYDPAVMRELGIIGIKPEPEKAKAWYEQAQSWGLPETERQLQARSSAPMTVGQH